MAKKRILIHRQLRGQARETIPLNVALNSIAQDDTDIGNTDKFNRAMLAKSRLAVAHLYELLVDKGLIDAADLADLPILNKENGDTVEIVDS